MADINSILIHILFTKQLLNIISFLNVTEFAKRGLIHASNVSNLRMCNSASVGPTALKFGGRPFLSLY